MNAIRIYLAKFNILGHYWLGYFGLLVGVEINFTSSTSVDH